MNVSTGEFQNKPLKYNNLWVFRLINIHLTIHLFRYIRQLANISSEDFIY